MKGVVPKHVVIFLGISWEVRERHKGSSMMLICIIRARFQADVPRRQAELPQRQKARHQSCRAWWSCWFVLPLLRKESSVHGSDAGHTPTLAMDHLLSFKQFVERNEAYGIAAFMQLVVVQPSNFHPIDPGLLTNAFGHVGDG
jgi:hypothetical protein